MQILCKRAQREFTLNLPSAAKYYANIYKIPESPLSSPQIYQQTNFTTHM